jgi:predicted O-methyltransferase YrrM
VIFAEDIPSAVSRAECEELARLAQGKVVLELGCQFGRSTIALASTALIVHTVDWFNYRGTTDQDGAQILSQFRNNLDRYGIANVVLHVGDLGYVLPGLRLRPEGVFLDAGHDEDEVYHQLELVIMLSHPDWIAIHDYDRDVAPEVRPAVERWQAWQHYSNLRLVETLAVLS